MHSQADSALEQPTAPSAIRAAAAGLALYLLTLLVEAVLAAGTRWVLACLGADALRSLRPLGLGVEQLAFLIALGPLAVSMLALVRPGRGCLFRRKIGARRPSTEEASALSDALALLRVKLPGARAWVHDNPLPSAAVRGRALFLSRGLIESDSLPAVLAHELGHLTSFDARLTEALDRLSLLAPADPATADAEDAEGTRPGGLLYGLAAALLRLAAGGIGERLLGPGWAAYWRSREYAADAHAARLGAGIDLAEHLRGFEQPLDLPRRVWPFDHAHHPPIALRIERLAEAVSQ
ncbi:MAG TPA: M48 family metalloprotease [Solirubrobacterales bacterium]|nr:M48 family metalloprotease [Solirubrobacterales bacterium]